MTVRVIETKDVATKTFETFYDRPSKREIPLEFGWPKELQEVGVGKAEMYTSNKWKKSRSDFEDYKHVAEGLRTVYAEPGFLRVGAHPARMMPVYGPMASFEEPMPKHFARLGPLLGVQVRLYDRDDKGELYVPGGDDRVYEVEIARAWLGSARHPGTKETFLFVYTPDGVHMILTGDKLSIEKDGIAG
jgi:hypothetical protein